MRYLSRGVPSEDDEDYVTIDPREPPYFTVTGVAVECSQDEGTFEMNVEQYISCDLSTKGAGGSRSKPFTRFRCHIPNSPKYKNRRPLPWNRRHVSIFGFLTKEERSDNNSNVEIYLIDVESITFCGVYTQPANPAAFVPQNGCECELL
jgi:hypothetical protein